MTSNAHYQRIFLAFIVLLAGTAVGAEKPDMRLRKKLIATGWDHPDSEQLLAHLAEMEKQPFDGVVLELTGRTAEGKPCLLRLAFSSEAWQPAWFQTNIDQLRACKCKRFTDNFITVGANPGDVDWFDDAGWQQVVEHWRIAAWIAKQSGCKGLLFDPEPYTPPHAQFGYAAQPGHKQHSFNQYAEKARQRGRQVMQAVVKEYPNITIFCYFMNSVSAAAAGRADPRPALAVEGYGLYPAMVDGWLDVAPPGVVLVDGCESAYLYNSRQQFLEAALLMKGACQELISPENRAKYRAQVQASFGLYLDAYWTPKGSPWYIDGRGGSRVERLRINTVDALAAADEYVWVYGEQFRWWPTPNGSVQPEKLARGPPRLRAGLALRPRPVGFRPHRVVPTEAGGPAREPGPQWRLQPRNGQVDRWRRAEMARRRTARRLERVAEGRLAGNLHLGPGSRGFGQGRGQGQPRYNGCFIQTYTGGRRRALRSPRRLQGAWQSQRLVAGPLADGRWRLDGRNPRPALLWRDLARSLAAVVRRGASAGRGGPASHSAVDRRPEHGRGRRLV